MLIRYTFCPAVPLVAESSKQTAGTNGIVYVPEGSLRIDQMSCSRDEMA